MKFCPKAIVLFRALCLVYGTPVFGETDHSGHGSLIVTTLLRNILSCNVLIGLIVLRAMLTRLSFCSMNVAPFFDGSSSQSVVAMLLLCACYVLVGSIIPRAMPCWPQSALIRLTAGTSKKEFLEQQIFLSFLGQHAIRSHSRDLWNFIQRVKIGISISENCVELTLELHWSDSIWKCGDVFSTGRLYRQTVHHQFYVSQRVEA